MGNNEKLYTNNLNQILALYPNSVDDEIISSAEQILKKNKYIWKVLTCIIQVGLYQWKLSFWGAFLFFQ